MNGMLPDPEIQRVLTDQHHREARQWARTAALGRLGKAAHDQLEQHPLRSRILVAASPLAVALGLSAILI
jgi:hypothetical protein